MAPRMDDIMSLCCELSANDQIKVAVKTSAIAAALAAGGAFAGGLLLGPVGIAVGATAGGLLGTWMFRGTFKPLPQILMELPPDQKEKLCSNVKALLGQLEWTDAPGLIAMVMGNADLKQQVIETLFGYITKELSAEVRHSD